MVQLVTAIIKDQGPSQASAARLLDRGGGPGIKRNKKYKNKNKIKQKGTEQRSPL